MTFFGMALLTAAVTLVLTAFAIVTVWYARRAFLKQSQEVQATELRESLAERTRQAEQMRHAQAARVFLTEEPFKGRNARSMAAYGEFIGVSAKLPSVTATAHNTSDQPIYNAELAWHRGSTAHGNPNPEPVGTLLPGATHTSTHDFPLGTNLEVSGAVLRFRDAAGTKWTRRPDGYLGEQPLPSASGGTPRSAPLSRGTRRRPPPPASRASPASAASGS